MSRTVSTVLDHGGGDYVVAEDLAPVAEWPVGGDDEAGALVAGRDELEERLAASSSYGM